MVPDFGELKKKALRAKRRYVREYRRRVTGVTWGMTPKVVHWLYTAVIRPMFCYATVIWWSRTTYKTVSRQLEHLQRLACLYISGVVRTTPTAALETVVGIAPLPVHVIQEAMTACNRLKLGPSGCLLTVATL